LWSRSADIDFVGYADKYEIDLAAGPDRTKTYCPAFDVPLAELIVGIITERGLIQPADQARIAAVLVVR